MNTNSALIARAKNQIQLNVSVVQVQGQYGIAMCLLCYSALPQSHHDGLSVCPMTRVRPVECFV